MWRSRWLRRILSGIVVTTLVTTVWLVGQREFRVSTGNRELAAAIEEAAAADPDWMWERLNAARVRPPAGRNGADVIPAVRALMPAEWVRDVNPERWEPDLPPLPPNVRLPAPILAEGRQMIARAAPAVDRARGLKDCPTGHRELPLTPDVFSTPMRDTPHTRTVARLLLWDAAPAPEE
jgi:hypothetical protein